jgi:hypothetical protein
MSRRSLRILFFVENPAAFWRYSPLVSELARRGHAVRLAFNHVPEGMVEELTGDAPQVTYGPAPQRGELDGRRVLASAIRRIADLARYAHPRYENAQFLRHRMAAEVLRELARRDLEPVGRWFARRLARRLAATSDERLSQRVIEAAARLDEAIPTSRRVDRFVLEEAPDVVLVTPVVKRTDQLEYLKSARRQRLPTGACIKSWDQLTNRGLLKFVPERVFVWNEAQRREAEELHGVPPERVVATGAQQFDEWFDRRPSVSREELMSRMGLEPADGYVLYLCSSPDITRPAKGEVAFVLRWLEAVRGSGNERLRRVAIVVRPHPNPAAVHQWRRVDLGRFGNAVVWPRGGSRPVSEEARAEFFDSLFHSDAVVGINTTSMIEAAIVGKSVLTVLTPEFAQESTLHFHHLLAENGGFLHVASSVEEHAGQLARVLEEDAAGAQRRRSFVEAFVRPHGLDRPATPILADAVEQLVEVPVAPPERGRLRLRVALTVEAGLSSVAIVVARALAPAGRLHAPRGLRRLRRRIGAKARRHGLLPSQS